MNGPRKKFDVLGAATKMGQVVFIMAEVFERENRARRAPNVGPSVRIVRPRKRRRGAIASFRRKLNVPDDIPASGRIVFRSASQILR